MFDFVDKMVKDHIEREKAKAIREVEEYKQQELSKAKVELQDAISEQVFEAKKDLICAVNKAKHEKREEVKEISHPHIEGVIEMLQTSGGIERMVGQAIDRLVEKKLSDSMKGYHEVAVKRMKRAADKNAFRLEMKDYPVVAFHLEDAETYEQLSYRTFMQGEPEYYTFSTNNVRPLDVLREDAKKTSMQKAVAQSLLFTEGMIPKPDVVLIANSSQSVSSYGYHPEQGMANFTIATRIDVAYIVLGDRKDLLENIIDFKEHFEKFIEPIEVLDLFKEEEDYGF